MATTSSIEWTDVTWRRFVAHIDVRGAEECWPWTAGLFTSGYGQFRVGTRKVRAHRAYFEKVVGSVPEGKILLHTCDNRRCCNPAHLRIGTNAENSADMVAKGRARSGAVSLPADRNPAARLTWAKVDAIRADARAGLTRAAIAKKYAISPSQAGNIIREKCWRAA